MRGSVGCGVAAVFGMVSIAFLLCGCEDDRNEYKGPPHIVTISDYLRNISSGAGIPEAAAYAGGPVPHKIQACDRQGSLTGTLLNVAPEGWTTYTIGELQLVLIVDTTRTDTGKTREYWSAINGETIVHLQHLTVGCDLRVALTGELLGRMVLEGDRKFLDSYTFTSYGGLPNIPDDVKKDDTVNYAPLVKWLRPYVEQ